MTINQLIDAFNALPAHVDRNSEVGFYAAGFMDRPLQVRSIDTPNAQRNIGDAPPIVMLSPFKRLIG